jgi:protein tyrosine kinase modulator
LSGATLDVPSEMSSEDVRQQSQGEAAAMNESKELSRREGWGLLGRRRREVRLVRRPQEQAGALVAAAPTAGPKFGQTDRARQLWEIVQRNRWAAVAGFVAVFVPALLWVLLAPPVYQAELRILVQRERAEGAVSSEAGPVSTQEVSSEIELLRSRELLEQVAQRQGLVAGVGASQADLERAVRRLAGDLDVGAVPNTNVIALRYAGRNPKQAAEVLNGLAALYLDKRAALERHGEALEFFQEQAGYQGQELEQAQQQMGEFGSANQVSLLREQKAGALRRIEELETELTAVSGEIQSSRRRLEQLRQQGEKLPATVKTESRSARNQALIEKLKSLLVELENQRTELLTRYEPGYRLVVEVEKKIADTQGALEREQQAVVVDETEALNPIRQSVEAEYFRTQTELAGLEARQRELRQKLGEQQGRQMRLEGLTAEHDTLERKLKLAEENYLRYEERKEQARIANALDLEQFLHVSIVEPAKEPALPAERNIAMVMLVGLLLASCTGVGAAVVRDRQNRAVTSAAEIAALTGLPVLSTAPEVTKR